MNEWGHITFWLNAMKLSLPAEKIFPSHWRTWRRTRNVKRGGSDKHVLFDLFSLIPDGFTCFLSILWHCCNYHTFSKNLKFLFQFQIQLKKKRRSILKPSIPVFVWQSSTKGGHCKIRIIKGFSQSISWCNFLHPGSGPMGFKGSLWSWRSRVYGTCSGSSSIQHCL